MITRNLTVFGFVMAALISFGLFQIKYVVLDLESQITSLNREIYTLQESIHILTAEYAALTAPDRLEKYAKSPLNLGPIKPRQYVLFEDLPVKKPQQTSVDSTLDSLVETFAAEGVAVQKKSGHTVVQEIKNNEKP